MPKAEDFQWKKGDLAAVAGILVLAAAIFLCFLQNGYGNRGLIAEIYLNGEKIREVNLSEDQTFTVRNVYENTVTVENGRISVSHSDCPGSDCVHSGWKSRAGESIHCLPNRMEIRIPGESDVDFVTGY